MQIQDTYLQKFLKSLVRIIVRASSHMRVTMRAILLCIQTGFVFILQVKCAMIF